MSAQGKFIIFCAEQYKAAKHLTGKQLSELFGKISCLGVSLFLFRGIAYNRNKLYY